MSFNSLSEIFKKLSEIRISTWITIAVIVVLAAVGLVLLSKKEPSQGTVNTKKLVYGGICVSVSFVLSYIRLAHMPYGGSVTLASMLPLVLYSMVFGPVAGIIAGVAYGFLQMIQDMSFVSIAQILFDYPLAFGCIGLAGIAPKAIKNIYVRTTLGITLAMFGRFVMHVISGVAFYADYAPDNMSPLVYSVCYNGAFMLAEYVITLVLAFIVVATPIYSTLKKNATLSLHH